MEDVESAVLARALGNLGGFDARWAARRLPSVAHQVDVVVPASHQRVLEALADSFDATAKPIPELSSDAGAGVLCGLVRSGTGGLNPTILRVAVATRGSGSLVSIRAVAKEGAVKQHSAIKAVERIEELLRGLA